MRLAGSFRAARIVLADLLTYCKISRNDERQHVRLTLDPEQNEVIWAAARLIGFRPNLVVEVIEYGEANRCGQARVHAPFEMVVCSSTVSCPPLSSSSSSYLQIRHAGYAPNGGGCWGRNHGGMRNQRVLRMCWSRWLHSTIVSLVVDAGGRFECVQIYRYLYHV